jgi:ANTAR domain/GAF domain
MARSDLADRTATLLSLAAASTEERSLSQLTLLAASQVPGCAAACVALWHQDELAGQAASHPDPSGLGHVQIEAGRGPMIEAIADGGPVTCLDTLTETRWPEFAEAALQVGVRSCVALVYRGPVVVSLSLFGVRPRAMDPQQLQLAELLVAYGSALVGAVSQFGDSQRMAAQLRDAAEARALVDQAKGILMHALGCGADEALARMREVSQRSNIRATEVARRVIDAHGGRAGRVSNADLAGLSDLAHRTGRTPA